MRTSTAKQNQAGSYVWVKVNYDKHFNQGV